WCGNDNNAFSSPPTPNALINSVNDLGYPKVIINLSDVVTNDMFQPWRALTTIINLCLTGKTLGFERPRAPVLQILWGGTKREVFEMPIPNKLITANIQGSDLDSPVLKPAKATKKSKPSAPKADLRPPVTKPASSQQPEPKPTPAKSQGKKLKLVTEMSDKPSLARRSKPGLVTKRRKPTSSLRSVDESVDEGIPEKEPRFDDEEDDIQMAVAKSLKSVYYAPRGPLPPVVIREPDSGKYQPLLEIRGKGKEKVSDEQVALDLLTLQTRKKKTPADKFIFQRRTSTPTESSGHDESSSLYDELGLTDSEENLKLTVEEQSMNRDHTDELLKDLAEVRKKKKKRRDSPKTPPGSPPHQPPPPPPPADLHMDDDLAPDAQAYLSHDEDIGNAHIPKVNLQKDWWKPFEEDRPVTPEPS
nr:hypothetical protein [Tanacetum cinerariifolium]